VIAIIDYGVGNVAAVANMLKRIGYQATVTAEASEIRRAKKLILPGNGSFDACMANLRSSGLIPLLEEMAVGSGVPLLGICVGAQLLGNRSMEGKESGLGWIDMESLRFPDSLRLPIPHMGWTAVSHGESRCKITEKLGDDARFYFVHSYYLAPARDSDVILWANYGMRFAAGVARGNLYGVQFHPEKSHRFGKMLLESFAGMDV
jgi:glutamine amidotransferase